MHRLKKFLSVYLTIGLILGGMTAAQAQSRAGLTGTYRLDASRSDDPQQIAAENISRVDQQRREEARRDLEQKLESPDLLAIDVTGNRVTIASTLAERIAFSADGSERVETLADGSTLRFRASFRGDTLTVSTTGSQNDYAVTFAPERDGTLRVTRRVTTDYMRETVFAESVYEKTDETARLEMFDRPDDGDDRNTNDRNANTGNYPPDPAPNNYPNNNRNYPPSTTNSRTGDYVVPNGTILTGTLEQNISTEYSQNNDPFRMRVTAPNQFRGAIVEGYVSGINRSRRGSASRTQLTLNFERIRLPNGETYDFYGFLQSVTNAKGETVKIDSEGSVKGDSTTREQVKRGGIGAGLGAVLGAIIGGGKGAAIGAIIGGAGGAGSVYATGGENLELLSGSSITVQASSPIR